MAFVQSGFVWVLGILVVVIVSGFFIIRALHIPNIKTVELIIGGLAGLSVILVIYNMYLNIQSNERIEKNRLAYNTIANIKNEYIDPQKELLDYFPEGYFLYASMVPEGELNKLMPKKFDIEKRRQVELYGSIRVFQSIEDFLSTAAFDITGIYIWINNYLMWMQSPILRYYWNFQVLDFSEDTRELIQRLVIKSDELIELRKKKGQLSYKDYDAISKDFPVTPR